MFPLRKAATRNLKFCWLLVIALIIQFLSQLQFHLHHGDVPESYGHEHIIDFHVFTDHLKVDHLVHDDAHELAFTPDGIVKKNLDDNIVFGILIWLLILVPITQTVVKRQWPSSRTLVYRRFYYCLAPPLRAPPAA